MRIRKEDKQIWIENKVIALINMGRSKSEAQYIAEEDWADMNEDLANSDEFECERCHGIFDIEDSIRQNGKLYCPRCSGDSKVLR